MSLVDELQKLEQLYQNGSLSAGEFAQAKNTLLAASSTQTPNIDILTKEVQLSRLDREWQITQERFKVTGRYGTQSLPTVTGGLTSIFLVGGFGTFWTIMAFSITSNRSSFSEGGFQFVQLFPFFGVLFVVFGIWSGLNEMSKARAYETAQTEYLQQRRKLESEP